MKIRLRHASGNTQRAELPEICDLRALRERVSAVCGIPLSSVHVSLNRREEITGSPGTLLSSLGICPGDLLYLIDSSSVTSNVSDVAGRPTEVQRDAAVVIPSLPTYSLKNVARSTQSESVQIRREKCASAAAKRLTGSSDANNILKPEDAGQNSEKTPFMEVGVGGAPSVGTASEHPNGNLKKIRMMAGVKETVVKSTVDDMDSEPSQRPGVVAPTAETESVLRVLTGETSSLQTESPADILVVLVHAIMLETGLTLNLPKDSPPQSYGLPAGWSSAQGPLTLSYGLAMAGSVSCTLRFQSLGGFLLVYGTRNGRGQLGNGDIYRLSLRVTDYCGPGGCLDGNTQQLSRKLRELVVSVKDKLSLPLLTAICQQAGLEPPLSLLLLPKEVKMQVLQRLPAPALAACACTCFELRHLSAEDDLWRDMYQKEFGNFLGSVSADRSWRAIYVAALQQVKQQEEERRQAEARSCLWMVPPPMAPPFFPYQAPPGIIGGDYDRFPGGISGGMGGGIGGGIGGGFGGGIGGGFGGLRGPSFGPDVFFAGEGAGWGHGAMGEGGDLPANSSLLGGLRDPRGSSAGLPPRSLQPRFQGPGRFI